LTQILGQPCEFQVRVRAGLYDPARPLIVAAQEVFGPRGANLLGKL
jgi:hypothetical protein